MGRHSIKFDCEKRKKWEKKVPTKVNIPRSINLGQNIFDMIGIHVFRDASFRKTYAAAHAVMQQPAGIKQGLFESK